MVVPGGARTLLRWVVTRDDGDDGGGVNLAHFGNGPCGQRDAVGDI